MTSSAPHEWLHLLIWLSGTVRLSGIHLRLSVCKRYALASWRRPRAWVPSADGTRRLHLSLRDIYYRDKIYRLCELCEIPTLRFATADEWLRKQSYPWPHATEEDVTMPPAPAAAVTGKRDAGGPSPAKNAASVAPAPAPSVQGSKGKASRRALALQAAAVDASSSGMAAASPSSTQADERRT